MGLKPQVLLGFIINQSLMRVFIIAISLACLLVLSKAQLFGGQLTKTQFLNGKWQTVVIKGKINLTLLTAYYQFHQLPIIQSTFVLSSPQPNQLLIRPSKPDLQYPSVGIALGDSLKRVIIQDSAEVTIEGSSDKNVAQFLSLTVSKSTLNLVKNFRNSVSIWCISSTCNVRESWNSFIQIKANKSLIFGEKTNVRVLKVIANSSLINFKNSVVRNVYQKLDDKSTISVGQALTKPQFGSLI